MVESSMYKTDKKICYKCGELRTLYGTDVKCMVCAGQYHKVLHGDEEVLICIPCGKCKTCQQRDCNMRIMD